MAQYLGIDFGTKRVGVAVADADVRLARPLQTLVGDDPVEQLRRLVESQGAQDVVVGLPRGLDGQETAQTAAVRTFADSLSVALGITVTLQDEAGTSSVAEDRLKEVGRPYQPSDIDAWAAAIILQDYLDNL